MNPALPTVVYLIPNCWKLLARQYFFSNIDKLPLLSHDNTLTQPILSTEKYTVHDRFHHLHNISYNLPQGISDYRIKDVAPFLRYDFQIFL